MSKKSYSDKLKSPHWQRKRLRIFNRDNYTCKKCGDTETQLHVHHLDYNNDGDPWDIDDKLLTTLCEDCHKEVEDLKKNEPDVNFKTINIYKSDNWANGSKIIFTSYPGICSMRIYDHKGEKLRGFNLNNIDSRRIISILKKSLNGI